MYAIDLFVCQKGMLEEGMTYGSPIMKESPALTDGISPREPTRAAAPSLVWFYDIWI